MAGSYPSPVVLGFPVVGVVAVQIAAPNPSRASLYVFNQGPTPIFVAPTTAFTTGGGPNQPFAALAGSGSMTIQPGTGCIFNGWTNGMSAICAVGTNTIAVWEYYQ